MRGGVFSCPSDTANKDTQPGAREEVCFPIRQTWQLKTHSLEQTEARQEHLHNSERLHLGQRTHRPITPVEADSPSPDSTNLALKQTPFSSSFPLSPFQSFIHAFLPFLFPSFLPLLTSYIPLSSFIPVILTVCFSLNSDQARKKGSTT